MKRLTQTPAHLGEGPCWHAAEGALYWVDILGKCLHRYHPDTGADDSWPMPQMIGTVAPRQSGGVLVALQHGLAFFEPDTSTFEHLPDIDTNPRTRFNDGKCDPQGRFWFGSMDHEEREALGKLYSMDTDGTVRAWEEDISISNGMAWSPDSRRMYYIDSPTRRIDVFNFDPETGTPSNRRPLVHLSEDDGYPDGMTSDQEGNLWLAHWGAAKVTKRDGSDGSELASFRTEAWQTSACCFGGPSLEDLYITSARKALSSEQLGAYPNSGHLLHLKTETKGSPTHPFQG